MYKEEFATPSDYNINILYAVNPFQMRPLMGLLAPMLIWT